MRDFLFKSEEILDRNALDILDKETIPGILPCKWLRWNSMIQLVYFTDNLESINEAREKLTFEDLRMIADEILELVINLESQMDLSLENVVWDLDTIYLDQVYAVHLICLPAVIPVEALESKIYIKRVYAILNDLFSGREDTEFVCRQIEAQREKGAADWEALRNAISFNEPKEDDTITMRGINTPEPIEFVIGHEEFVIGSDETVDGYLNYPSISPIHATVGWNDISYYIEDAGSESGTYLNDVKLSQNNQIPFGSGSIVKFGDYTFNVE